MALGGSVLKRLPLTTSVLYLAVGFGLGPHGADLLDLDPLDDARLLEHLTEVAVLISLFTAGLNMRVDFRDRRWLVPLRLAFGSMAITVGLIAAVGWSALGLSLGAAILLGAILAPTDPVLASEVQLNDPMDRDTLRFSLTGEAGFNDGTAFPFVMLGLGILGRPRAGHRGAALDRGRCSLGDHGRAGRWGGAGRRGRPGGDLPAPDPSRGRRPGRVPDVGSGGAVIRRCAAAPHVRLSGGLRGRAGLARGGAAWIPAPRPNRQWRGWPTCGRHGHPS